MGMSMDCYGAESGVVKMRPDFGKRQVKDLKNLVVGRKYIAKGAHSSKMFTLESLPYENGGKWKINIFRNKRIIDTDSIYLADYGVMPYDNGYWNATNHILEVG